MFTKHSPSEILSLNFEKKALFKLQFSDLMVCPYYTRKDTMTSFTQGLKNAVCVTVAYLVCSAGVLRFQTLRLVFCIINKLCSHAAFVSIIRLVSENDNLKKTLFCANFKCAVPLIFANWKGTGFTPLGARISSNSPCIRTILS